MVENWKPVPGWEGLYEVSDMGRVRSLAFMQRYLLRNGKPAFRKTAERILAVQSNNRGYRMVKLNRNGKSFGFLVHRLVAAAFLPNPDGLPEVNHKDGVKENCCVGNLEWCTRSRNKQHAVSCGLNTQAIAVIDPTTGALYPSISQAAKGAKVAHRTVRAKFERVTCPT
jgi:hypothetical protein